MIWRAIAATLGALLVASLVWAIGFTEFERKARKPASPPPHADGIVALTGGADRIETALHLLAEGKAPVLLVSGVGRGADLAEVARRVPIEPAAIARRVTLGHAATSTAGNASETASWAHRHDVHSLIVVTAGYHMARALLEMRRDLPDIVIYAVPVQPPALRNSLDLATLRLLATEYDKLLAVRVGIRQLLRKDPAT